MSGAASDTRAPARAGLETQARRLEGLPILSLRLFARGGQRAEPVPGQAYATSRMLVEGTAQRSWRDLARECDERGASIEPFSGGAAHGLALDALASDWEWLVDRAAELMLESAFPEERFEWIVAQTATDLRGLADRPEARTAWSHLDQLYRPHPFATPAQGSLQHLAELDAESCAAWHRSALAHGLGVAAAGDIDEDQVYQRIEQRFASAAIEAPELPVTPTPIGGEPRREIEAPGDGQAHLYVGRLTVDRLDPDLPALELLGVVLGAGDGLEGRLPTRLREREGLAYAVGVQIAAGAGLDRGRLAIYAGTSIEQVAALEGSIAEELERVRTDGIEPGELEAARSYLIGSDAFRRETARQQCDLLAARLLYGEPYDSTEWARDRWSTVTRGQVRRVARRHLDEREFRVTLGLPVLNQARGVGRRSDVRRRTPHTV